MTTITKLDVDALRRAHEEHDPELLASLYADGAESITVDVNNPPSRPRTVRGKDEIGAFWEDIMSRGMTHKVQGVVEGENQVAYQVACQYDDGTRVLASGICELADGKITRETVVQAWDS